jgi:hypothetical protein
MPYQGYVPQGPPMGYHPQQQQQYPPQGYGYPPQGFDPAAMGNMNPNIPPIEPPGPGANIELTDLVGRLENEDMECAFNLQAPKLHNVVFDELWTPIGIILELAERVAIQKKESKQDKKTPIVFAEVSKKNVLKRELSREEAKSLAEQCVQAEKAWNDDPKNKDPRTAAPKTWIKPVMMRRCKFSLQQRQGPRMLRYDVMYTPEGGAPGPFNFQTHQCTAFWDKMVGEGNWIDPAKRDNNKPEHKYLPKHVTDTSFELSISRSPVCGDRVVQSGPCQGLDSYWVKFAEAYMKMEVWMVRTVWTTPSLLANLKWAEKDKEALLAQDVATMDPRLLRYYCSNNINDHYLAPMPPGVKRPTKTPEEKKAAKEKVYTLEESAHIIPGHVLINSTFPAFSKLNLLPGQQRTFCNVPWARQVEIQNPDYGYTHTTGAQVQYWTTVEDPATKKAKPTCKPLDEWARQNKKVLGPRAVARFLMTLSFLPTNSDSGAVVKSKIRTGVSQIVIVGASPQGYSREADAEDNDEEEGAPDDLLGEDSFMLDEEEKRILEKRKRMRQMVAAHSSQAMKHEAEVEKQQAEDESNEAAQFDPTLIQAGNNDLDPLEQAMGTMPMETPAAGFNKGGQQAYGAQGRQRQQQQSRQQQRATIEEMKGDEGADGGENDMGPVPNPVMEDEEHEYAEVQAVRQPPRNGPSGVNKKAAAQQKQFDIPPLHDDDDEDSSLPLPTVPIAAEPSVPVAGGGGKGAKRKHRAE